MSYVILNSIVLLSFVVLGYMFFKKNRATKHTLLPFWGALTAVVGLTAIFDSLIIAASIVAYDTDHILGVYIGRAPVEDFAYACVSVILVVVLWEYYEHQG